MYMYIQLNILHLEILLPHSLGITSISPTSLMKIRRKFKLEKYHVVRLMCMSLHKAISFSMATQENNIEQIFDKKNA